LILSTTTITITSTSSYNYYIPTGGPSGDMGNEEDEEDAMRRLPSS